MEMQTCESSGLIGGNGPEVPQIALVAHQHDDDVVIRVIPQLLQPAFDVFVSQMFCDVIDQKSSNCTPVVPLDMLLYQQYMIIINYYAKYFQVEVNYKPLMVLSGVTHADVMAL